MFIMVLNDGETFTDLNGCHIAQVPDDATTEDIEHYLLTGESSVDGYAVVTTYV